MGPCATTPTFCKTLCRISWRFTPHSIAWRTLTLLKGAALVLSMTPKKLSPEPCAYTRLELDFAVFTSVGAIVSATLMALVCRFENSTLSLVMGRYLMDCRYGNATPWLSFIQ